MKFPYGNADFYDIVTEKYFYIDRTDRIPLTEEMGKTILFLRPRRFGKSLWLSTLRNYYDVNRADEFEKLFGHLAIGQNPTAMHNRYFILKWNFSKIETQGSSDEIRQALHDHINGSVEIFKSYYRDYLDYEIIQDTHNALRTLESLFAAIARTPYKVYLLIDEYDNFANQLIVAHKDRVYADLMADDGFLKTFFKTLKEGRKDGAIANVFMTGVLPMIPWNPSFI